MMDEEALEILNKVKKEIIKLIDSSDPIVDLAILSELMINSFVALNIPRQDLLSMLGDLYDEKMIEKMKRFANE